MPARGGIMKNKLCQKCQETLGIAIYEGCHHPPWWHCHHDDPEIDYQKPWREAAEWLLNLPEKPREDVIKWAENHYWSSLQKDKALIIKHIKESFCSGEKPKEKELFCNGCKWLSLAEEDQTLFYEPHVCTKRNIRLFHYGHHPKLPRPEYCYYWESEKPKEPCWCELKDKQIKISGFYKSIYREFNTVFCPICGKKL